MSKRQYIIDNDDFNVKKAERRSVRLLRMGLMILIASISLAVVYYFIFAIFFNTEKDRVLRNENRAIEKMYPELQAKADLLSDVVEGLRHRDDAIYEDIFKTSAPDMDRLLSVELLPVSDTLDGEGIELMTAAKADVLLESARNVDANMLRIFELYSEKEFEMPPMRFPLKAFTLRRVGASVGKKINPFYKVTSDHAGIDLLAGIGDSVYVSASGIVSDIIRSTKGLGNVVVVDHGNGYKTRYGHLTDIRVLKGRHVNEGDFIGKVGMTGASFAPHLHYEVIKDTTVVDPVNYFFSSVNPYEYASMFILSSITGQSLD